MNPAETAFLSLLRWPAPPNRMDRAALASVIARAAALDPFLVSQRLGAGTPAVIQRLDASIARAAVRELRARGIDAFAPTLADLHTLAGGTPVRAKRLSPALGAPEPMFLCEPWRGEPFGFAARSIGAIVRARINRNRRAPARTERSMAYEPLTGTVIPILDVVRESRSSLHDVMDIYLRDRRCVRCSGDKFNFDGLGAARGFTDNENMDKLAVMLADAAPHALVDLGFAEFSCPQEIAGTFRTTPGGAGVRDDHPVFDFYSPWIILVHAALAAREKSPG
jgi:hypothetical protein